MLRSAESWSNGRSIIGWRMGIGIPSFHTMFEEQQRSKIYTRGYQAVGCENVYGRLSAPQAGVSHAQSDGSPTLPMWKPSKTLAEAAGGSNKRHSWCELPDSSSAMRTTKRSTSPRGSEHECTMSTERGSAIHEECSDDNEERTARISEALVPVNQRQPCASRA